MKNFFFSVGFWSLFFPDFLYAQPGFGSGSFEMPPVECITPAQEKVIKKYLNANQEYLKSRNLLPEAHSDFTTSLHWPLQTVSTVKDPSYFGIAYYIDQDKDASQLLDYNCGTRTYDGHNGVDIVLYPFPQIKQELGLVNIVAAAPGTIIGKADGNPDKNCGTCGGTCTPNAVYIQHADGTVAFYTHMKNGSPTEKAIGQTVALGEYLGKVGSSGNSGAPHLHFHIWRQQPLNTANWLDPFAGTCNSLNADTSFWLNQRPYRRPFINKIMTGSAAIVIPACPALETTNEKNVFAVGEGVYVTSFYQDILQGAQQKMELIRPDGALYTSWLYNSPGTYNMQYFYWGPWNLPNLPGYWKFRVTYVATGQEVTHTFYYGANAPVVSIKSGDFNDPAVWSNNTVPSASANLFVCHGVLLKDDRTITSLVVNEGGQVVVENGKKLQVGNVIFQKPNAKSVD